MSLFKGGLESAGEGVTGADIAPATVTTGTVAATRLTTSATTGYPIEVQGSTASGVSLRMPNDTWIYWVVGLGFSYQSSSGLTTNATLSSNAATNLGSSSYKWGALYLANNLFMTAGDSSASPGDATLNNAAGKSAIAAGASAAVITSSKVSSTSIILVTPLDNDTTLTRFKAVPASGSFTVTGNANATATWKFQWFVVN